MNKDFIQEAVAELGSQTITFVKVSDLGYDRDSGERREISIRHSLSGVLIIPAKSEEQMRMSGMAVLRTAGYVTAHEFIVVIPTAVYSQAWERCHNRVAMSIGEQKFDMMVVRYNGKPHLTLGTYAPIDLEIKRSDYFELNGLRMMIGDIARMPDDSTIICTIKTAE
jgi:hypothetical protein